MSAGRLHSSRGFRTVATCGSGHHQESQESPDDSEFRSLDWLSQYELLSGVRPYRPPDPLPADATEVSLAKRRSEDEAAIGPETVECSRERKRIALSLRTHVTVVYLTVVSDTALITSTANVGLNPKPAGAKKIRGRTLDVEVQTGGQVKTTPVKRKGRHTVTPQEVEGFLPWSKAKKQPNAEACLPEGGETT